MCYSVIVDHQRSPSGKGKMEAVESASKAQEDEKIVVNGFTTQTIYALRTAFEELGKLLDSRLESHLSVSSSNSSSSSSVVIIVVVVVVVVAVIVVMSIMIKLRVRKEPMRTVTIASTGTHFPPPSFLHFLLSLRLWLPSNHP